MGASGIVRKYEIATGIVLHSEVYDYNRDGKLDLLVTNTNGTVDSDLVVVYLGDGKGGFARSTSYAVDSYPSMAVPFVEDNQIKVVSANYHDTLSIVDGHGQIAMQSVVAGGGPNAVAVADFDSDGRLDFAVANHFGSSIAIVHNESVNAGCRGHDDNGHGNDDDGHDESNPGKSFGVSEKSRHK